MRAKDLKIFALIALIYPFLSGGLTGALGLFSAWGFGMTTFPDLTQNRVLFPSLIFSPDNSVREALLFHLIASGLIYAAGIMLVIYGCRWVEKFRTGA